MTAIIVPLPQAGHRFILVGFYASIEIAVMQGINLIFSIAVLVISVVVHEVSHGLAAYALGDGTAKRAGRLSMNPFKHLDLIGSFIVPLILVISSSPFVFGWAKPVPYNPYNLKNQKWGPGIVAVSGPLSNFIIAAVFSLAAFFIPLDNSTKTEIALNAVGGGEFSGTGYLFSLFYFCATVVWINIFLGIFNLIPIPPLDGSKVLFTLMPYKWSKFQQFMEKYGFFILIIFILLFSNLLLPVVFFVYKTLLNLS